MKNSTRQLNLQIYEYDFTPVFFQNPERCFFVALIRQKWFSNPKYFVKILGNCQEC